jgi:hypothetical protein
MQVSRRIAKMSLVSVFALGVAMTAMLAEPVAGQFSTTPGLSYSRFSRNAAQQTLRRPTVSPYLQLAYNGGLINTSAGPAFPTYQTLVRPQLEARDEALAQQQQYAQLQKQVMDIRSAVQTQQQNGLFATGHPTRFGIHSHFYPALDAAQQR